MDLISTVAVVEGFGTCVVGAVVLLATSWSDSLAFWSSDTRKKIFNKKEEFFYVVQRRAEKFWSVSVSSLIETAVEVSQNNKKCYENTRQR